MNPFSSWTYIRRHKGRTGLILGLIAVTTCGLYMIIAGTLIMFFTPFPFNSTYLRQGALVQPLAGDALDATMLAQLRAQPDVDQVVAENGLDLLVPSLLGNSFFPFRLLGLQQADMTTLMTRYGVTLKEGRFLQPRTNEIMLSAEMVANLGLHLGDEISRERDKLNYENLHTPLRLVGILAGDVRLGLISYEYLSSHERYRQQVVNGALVVSKTGRNRALDNFLISEIRSNRAKVVTLSQLEADQALTVRSINSFLGPIAVFISLVLMLVIGVIQRIDFMRRLPELGILHVTGQSKGWLLRRLTLENSRLALIGWLIGISLPILLLTWLIAYFLAPRGFAVDPLQWSAFWLTVPVPVAVVLFTSVSMRQLFARLDGIAIIEHGELNPTSTQQQPSAAAPRSTVTGNPLASLTFYQRHRWQAGLLVGTMTLMIMAVVILIFIMTTTLNVLEVDFADKRLMSVVTSTNQANLSAGVAAQIRSQTAVERVIPSVTIVPLSIFIPPFSNNDLYAYAVGEADLQFLVNLYDLQIKEGRLPKPRSNELIIPEAVAANRGLKLGDVVGDFAVPAYQDAPTLPTTFVITGIFARSPQPEQENWLIFASLEFIQNHEGFGGAATKLLVVAKAGQKDQVDDWLTSTVANVDSTVTTYRQQSAEFHTIAATVLTMMGLIEGVIALIAAVALGVLNYIFIGQRQSEFGVLNALGYGRLWLVWRTVRETIFTTASAWVLSIVLCIIGLVYLQYGVFQPRGLGLDLFNPTPWYYTLPVPVTVLLVSAATVARLLYWLDPVAVIEKA